MHSSRFFRVKPIGRLFYEVRKIGKPYNFLPIPTIKFNDTTVLNDTVLNDTVLNDTVLNDSK